MPLQGPLKQQKSLKMSSHFHFSRLASHFNSRAAVGDFMNGWVWTSAPDTIFPTSVKRHMRWGERGAHLEVGIVPQQVPRVPALSMVTLNSRDPGHMSFFGILLGSAQGQGPPGIEHGPLLYYTARVRFRLKSWMRKGDSHLELLIYLASILHRQSPGGGPY